MLLENTLAGRGSAQQGVGVPHSSVTCQLHASPCVFLWLSRAATHQLTHPRMQVANLATPSWLAVSAVIVHLMVGAWTEMWWRFNLRELGAAACELAEDYRCYRDPLPAKTAEEKEEIRLRILQTNPM